MEFFKRSTFAQGLLDGLYAATIFSMLSTLVVAMLYFVPAVSPERLVAWSEANLGFSVFLFALTLALFFGSMLRLARLLEEGANVERVAHADHLVDIWINTFFGVGVIWTAIGMRGALVGALGDTAGAAEAGAYAILQRLVEGGILTALSTTIVGGVGGYLMRVVKALGVGTKLTQFYSEDGSKQGAAIHSVLSSIDASLQNEAPRGDTKNGRFAMETRGS